MIPALSGDATDQTPPDLPSYLFKERIVYLVSLQGSSGSSTVPRQAGRSGRQCRQCVGWWEAAQRTAS